METLERFESCVACGTILDEPPIIRIESANLIRCGSCGSWTRFPRPTAQEQAAIHDSAEYFGHPYFKRRRELKAKRSTATLNRMDESRRLCLRLLLLIL